MMKSRLDSRKNEAHNARNLLLWEQEVFSWAGSETEESRRTSLACGSRVPQSLESKSPNPKLGLGVLKGGLEVLLVGFALLYPPCALDPGRAEGRSPFAEGIGMSPTPQYALHDRESASGGAEPEEVQEKLLSGVWGCPLASLLFPTDWGPGG